MWLKLFFLLLYFMFLFTLARIFEAVVWYETGVLASQLVDPLSLSVKKLKIILECRGLGYAGLADKKDVSQLLHNSGELTHGELYSAIKKETEQTEAGDASSLDFSGEMHFYELVEDTKDGVWLIQVIGQDREALLSKSNWGKMVQKVSQFGIRTGTFNCSLDHRSCIRRGWQRSTLIMSVPQTSASKGKVILKEYNGRRVEPEHIFRWMTSHLSHHMKRLSHLEKLQEEWRPDLLHPLKMFLFASLPQPPVFFSSLSIKFTGRIEFIFVDMSRWDNHSSLLEIGVTQSPAYILKMPEGIYHYGNSTGEFLSVAAMDTFLRSVQPEVNDLFVLSLVIINLLAWMDLFITQGPITPSCWCPGFHFWRRDSLFILFQKTRFVMKNGLHRCKGRELRGFQMTEGFRYAVAEGRPLQALWIAAACRQGFGWGGSSLRQAAVAHLRRGGGSYGDVVWPHAVWP
ncbi:E3 ubiquitin-protein ligase RNF103 isoform X8 [Syngnathoides biaculeatus]|uniref:E3 ubiquitin-protein ligase RNF103 isoform X8 n=1 Tax=Syngnathoides biaculeatus TaxID=300417 RepID=UPI002ADDB68E|nr:E3 ubiquitin-protein ligase RNF103 isoform X8 [Syngnathoides biaculeatus]